MKYENDARFDAYYLEDSYVLEVDETNPHAVTFYLLLVLTPKHPLYSNPKPTEQHCYRKGQMIFDGVSAVNWTKRTFKPIRDPDGSVDYGNIDFFDVGADDRYLLEGEWGNVTLTAESVSITVSHAS